MLSLNLPSFDAKIAIKDGKRVIFDSFRQKYVALTPEEWVRQHFVHWLVSEKSYPKLLIANEIQIQIHATRKRCDTVVYDRQLRPRMVVEYKAPQVEIAQQVFDQITRYNMVLKVDYLVVSNGIKHYCCRMDYLNGSYQFITEIPNYSELVLSR